MGAGAGSVIGGLVGAGGGVAKFLEGRKMQRKAQDAINQFQWQELQNPFRNQQVSTLGADLQKEQADKATAGAIQALTRGGARGLAQIGRVTGAAIDQTRQAAADLDRQRKEIDFAASQQDVANQQMVERRQAEELAGYGQMMNVGMQNKWQGVGNVMNSAFNFGAQQQLGQALNRQQGSQGTQTATGGAPPNVSAMGAMGAMGATPPPNFSNLGAMGAMGYGNPNTWNFSDYYNNLPIG